MAGGCNLAEDFRIVGGVLADREEDRLDAFVGERLEHRRSGRPRAVVEGQHDLMIAQEVELLEMLEAEARPAGGVDLDRARDAERVRIVAFGGRTWRRRREPEPARARRGRRGEGGGLLDARRRRGPERGATSGGAEPVVEL